MNLELLTAGIPLITLPVLAYMLVGTTIGIIIGAMPGLTAMMAVSILVPLTYSLNATEGILMLLGVYSGANYGGSISATLINIPGTPSAMMTTLDGYPLGQKGKAGLAIGTATVASAIGGIFSVIMMVLFAPYIASIALKFTSLEIFAIALFGVSIMAYISPGSVLKGLIAGVFGLIVGCIGFDPVTSVPRFTFGQENLLSGVQFISAMIGLFGLSEILLSSEKLNHLTQKLNVFKFGSPYECLPFFPKMWGNLLRSSIVGVIVGAIPGTGGTIAAILGYAVQKKMSKHPEEMGKGAVEGVAAPEAANNACCGGAMTTLLSLGIPGDAVTAILVGAFILHGLTPGPMLFETNPSLISAIFLGMMIVQFMFIFLGMNFAHHFARLLTVPRPILNTVILALCVVGTYGVQNSVYDIGTMLVFAVLGYIMARTGIPRAPIVLALILGPLMEENLRRWMALTDGRYVESLLNAYSTNPIAVFVFGLTLLTIFLPIFQTKTRINEGMAEHIIGANIESTKEGK